MKVHTVAPTLRGGESGRRWRPASAPATECRAYSRRGITLLEVLISIGVISVGILGAATMLPMASYFQGETTKYDRGGALAQQAVHDLEVKSYLSPRRWIFIDPTNPNASGAGSWLGIAQLNMAGAASRSAFIIDPLGWANAAQQSPAVTFPCFFPAFPSQLPNQPGGGPVIFRAGITANDYWPPAATMPVAAPIPMSYSVADRMMRGNDDVLFEYDPASLRAMKRAAGQPDDFDQRPLAITNAGVITPSANAPNFAGEFSWIATVSRVASDMGAGVVAADLHRFQVTVVVLANRDLTLWTGAGGITLEEPPSERQVFAMFTQYGGMSNQSTAPFYGGGGLQLYVYENPSPPVAAGTPSHHWLDNIKPNTYLMLAANFIDTYNGGLPYPRLSWYRITNVDDGPNQDPNNNSRWYRNLTVTGSDWPALWSQPTNGNMVPLGPPVPFWIGADPAAPDAMIPYSKNVSASPFTVPVCFCTLMNNSIAAYDETITLDYSLVHE